MYILVYVAFKGVYSVGWLSSGPVGVILSTMSNAFQVATLVGQHFEKGLLNEHKLGYEYISKVLKDKGICYNRFGLQLEVKNVYWNFFLRRHHC